MSNSYLLAIDQGTSNSRAIIFDQHSRLIGMHEKPLTQFYPHPGWVEQDPLEMFNNTIYCCHQALQKANLRASQIACIGISNQRETTIIWDKQTGELIYPAIVWQDRRTTELCKQISEKSIAKQLLEKTGLILDPYFSATKIIWMLEHIPHARERAQKGELLFGTVDTYLLWKLTKAKVHATDATNASRTLLFNIKELQWDKEILEAFQIPASLLPQVLDNAADFGETDPSLFGQKIRICGMAGDQQAATIGQACFEPGEAKITLGTGGFLLVNTGQTIVQSSQQLLSVVAYSLNHQVTYGIEGSFFSAGTSIKWLRDTLNLLQSAAQSEILAQQIPDNEGVYLVPAFTGLGAPYWQPHARAAIFGLTRNSGAAHFARAALESVAYQTRDLLQAISTDYKTGFSTLNVDGGMAENNWLMQFLADITEMQVARPACIETSALGAAYLAGLQVGIFNSLENIQHNRKIQIFKPTMSKQNSNSLYDQWKKVIATML